MKTMSYDDVMAYKEKLSSKVIEQVIEEVVEIIPVPTDPSEIKISDRIDFEEDEEEE